MAKKRIKITKSIQETVRNRQKNGCAICIEIGKIFHHVLSCAEGGFNSPFNIILLCVECHKKIHLGDIDHIIRAIEYLYYIKNQELPESHEKILELAETIKKEHLIVNIKMQELQD